MTPRKSTEQKAIDAWNRHHPAGTPVAYWTMRRAGKPTAHGVTTSPAFVMGGSAVVRVESPGRGSDAIALSHVAVLPTLTLIGSSTLDTAWLEVFLPTQGKRPLEIIEQVEGLIHARGFRAGTITVGEWGEGLRLRVGVKTARALDTGALVDRLLVDAGIEAVPQLRRNDPEAR